MKKFAKYVLGIVISGVTLGLGFGIVYDTYFYTPSTELSDYYVEPLSEPVGDNSIEHRFKYLGK